MLLAINDCYQADTRLLLRYLEDTGQELTVESLSAYARHLKDRALRASTVNKRLQAAKNRLRLVFRASEESRDVLAGYELDRALKEIRGLKRNTRAVDASKVLTEEERRRLLTSEAIGKRVRLFMEFLLATGVRVSEATGIRLTDLRREPGFYLVRILGKGSKERTIKAGGKLMGRIFEVFGGTVYLFETKAKNPYDGDYLSDQIRLAGKSLLGRTISAHTMRHTFATAMIRKTRKVKGVSTYLGHSSTSITQDMYVHEELDAEDLDLE